MSTYFKAWGTALSTCPDPTTWMPVPRPSVAYMANAKPVAQGYEQGDLTWSAITPADYADLWGRWNTNKDSSGSFDIPNRAGTTPQSFRTVTAYAEDPRGQWGANIRSNVTMHIIITGTPG
jgi:hypothetical protein